MIAWQLARGLAKDVYILARKFPREEMFALASQVKRAVISITSNIAEGHGRGTRKDYINFLSIAIGSSCELESQLILACDLGFITNQELKTIEARMTEFHKVIYSLRKSLKTTLEPRT